MAISWGSWGGHLRVGVDVTRSGLTYTYKWYVGIDGWDYSDQQTLNFSGDIDNDDSVNFTNDLDAGGHGSHQGSVTDYKLVATRTYDATPGEAISVTATLSGSYLGETPSKTYTTTAPSIGSASKPSASSITATGATINWSLPTNAQSVQIQLDNSSGFGSTHADYLDSTPPSAPFSVGGPGTPNSIWYARIRGYLDGHYGSWSSTLTFQLLPTAPTAPSSVTATRSSDTSIGLAWTRNATSGAPYTGQSVRVSIDGAASVLVANVSATATSYTYTASANHKYVFYIAASNSAGSATSSASNTILTTPAALATLTAAFVSSGTIRLTLAKRPTPYTEAQIVIQETHNGGSSWSTKTTLNMSSLSATTTTTWNDTSAETSGTIQYRARVNTNGGTQGTLYSGYKTSNTLALNTPPLAPTNITPSGTVDASNAIRLAWTHSPSSDGASQSSRKIEYSDDDGSSWTSIVAGNTTTAYYDWTPDLGDFTAGQTILFRVATAGSQPGTYGAWSASQSLTLYGALAVTLVADNPPAVHGGGPLPVAWTSSPTWGTASQSQYQVTMTDDTSGLLVYDTGMVAGTGESLEIPSSVQEDGRTYTVAVTLLDNHHLASPAVTAGVEMDYLAPGPVELEWLYDDATGTLVLYPTFSEESSSALDDTAAWTLERSFDGTTWTMVGSAEGATPIGDSLARLGVVSWYRTVGYTSIGVAGLPTTTEIPAADVQSRWGWLNYGDNYQLRVRFGWSQTVDIASGRASESYDIEGLDYPGSVHGAALADKRGITGKLLSGSGIPASLATSSGDDMVDMSKVASTCVFRDPRGTWFLARVSDMRVSQPRWQTNRPDEAMVAFTIERVSA